MQKVKYPAAVLLDRDGTINPDDFGYINDPEQYYLYPYAADAIKLLNQLGYYVLLVTNQGGVARGYITLEEMHKVLQKALDLLAAEGAVIDKVYYSPYYYAGVVEPYNIPHEDRKPGLGMFRRAVKDFHFRPEYSWMIGDRYSDIAFGKKAGLKTILLLSGEGKKEFTPALREKEFQPDFVVKDLSVAAKLIASLT
ncbi:MAG: D-glycero-alpha-D-manno-heptose-1,7-bisphosphate 7-phosphatase [Candidatus Cloacimonadaceae bacterium]